MRLRLWKRPGSKPAWNPSWETFTGERSFEAETDDQADQLGGYAIEVYVVAELNEERQRRVRIDDQGKSLITGSTALSALAFAATTFITTRKGWELPRLSLWALGLTFLAFMVAAFCGLRGGGRLHQNVTAPIETFDKWRRDDARWFGGRAEVSREQVGYLIHYLEEIRRFNDRRARWVRAGSWSQIVALLGLSAAVAVVLFAAMNPTSAGPHHWLCPPNGSADTGKHARAAACA